MKWMSSIKNSFYSLPGFSFLRSKSSFDGVSLASDKNDCKTESKNDSKIERKKSSSSSQVSRSETCAVSRATGMKPMGRKSPRRQLPAGQDYMGIGCRESRRKDRPQILPSIFHQYHHLQLTFQHILSEWYWQVPTGTPSWDRHWVPCLPHNWPRLGEVWHPCIKMKEYGDRGHPAAHRGDLWTGSWLASALKYTQTGIEAQFCATECDRLTGPTVGFFDTSSLNTWICVS